MDSALLALISARRGHFQTESGYHTDWWCDLDRLLADRARLRPFVAALAQRLAAHRPDAICGPETGGARLAEQIAAELGLESFALARHAPPDAVGFFPVRYRLAPADHARVRGRRVALVDDAISAGSAIRSSHADLVAHAARPVALGALLAFGDGAARFASTHALALEVIATQPLFLWPPADCPLCRAGIPCERPADSAPRPPPRS